ADGSTRFGVTRPYRVRTVANLAKTASSQGLDRSPRSRDRESTSQPNSHPVLVNGPHGTNSAASYENASASAVEGSSSLKSQLAVAQRYAESADHEMSASPVPRCTDQVVDDTTASTETSVPSIGHSYRSLPLPPTSAVVTMLRKLKEMAPSSFVVLRCLMPISDYIDLCRNVYFSIDDYSDTEFIIANSGLFYLFTEYFYPSGNTDLQRQYLAWGQQCRNALLAAVGSLGACLLARPESVRAVVIGASHAVEVAKPWFAWRLSCYAAQLCVAGGFHDTAFMKIDDEETRRMKSLLFWYVYSMEKGLALRLGRASFVRECDITLSRDMKSLFLPKPWDSILPFWAWNAFMHSKLYEVLYSQAATSASDEEVIVAADRLLDELKAAETCHQASHSGKMDKLEDVLIMSQKVSYYITATLIARAKLINSSPSTWPPDCLEFARAAIQRHHEVMRMIREDRHMMNIYLHCLEDLQRLGDFAESLSPSADLSPAADELFKVSKDLYDTAKRQMETRMENVWVSPGMLSNTGLNQYFATALFPGVTDSTAIPDSTSEQLELMFGGQQIMGFF
ncbi:fungal specific transcription factor domain-containing protein, partial [Colletotrichum plurivorum]